MKPGQADWRVVPRAHLDAELLDPIPEAALRDPEDLGRARLHALRLLERVQDHPPLPLLERLVERARQPRTGLHGGPRLGRALDRGGEVIGADHPVGEHHGPLEHVLESRTLPGPE